MATDIVGSLLIEPVNVVGMEGLQAQNSPTAAFEPDLLDDNLLDTEDFTITRLSSEEVSSLLEPAISRTATRYKSARTPAIEKEMIMEEGDGYFAEEELAPDIYSSDEAPTPKAQGLVQTDSKNPGLSLGKLPSPTPVDSGLPITPWRPGPKVLRVAESPTPPSRSVLQGVFSNRTRSLSGGAEVLRKMLPRGLPSMAQVGNIFSPSSNSPPKGIFGFGNSSSTSRETTKLRKQDRFSSSQPSSGQSTPRFRSSSNKSMSFPASGQNSNGSSTPSVQTPRLRRVNSDDVLYHSLSRASSLGDDTRFENQTEMINSRAKAIRDSLQDRSSFRLPQMPSIPSMPRMSDFSFNMNFLNNSTTEARPMTSTDPKTGILTSNIRKKKSIGGLDSTAASSLPDTTDGDFPLVDQDPGLDLLDTALKSLTGDIVIMGGYRGSVLRSAKTHRQVWVPVKVGLNIRKVDLEVGLEPEDEERMEETIYSSGMLQNIGPVDISRRLFKRLRECENVRNGTLRVWDYGYDWRLSPHLLSRKLTKFLKSLPSNQDGGEGALVVAHSLGGLITRHVVNQHPELFSGVIYAGVPHACINILGPLRNGDAVLLSSRVLTAQVNFTLRTSFVLLPEDGGCFLDINTKERYNLDFFDVNDWIKYRLSPCTDPPLPPRNPPPMSQGPFESLISMSSNFTQKRKSISFPSNNNPYNNKATSNYKQSVPFSPTKTTRAADVLQHVAPHQDRTLGMQMDNNKSQTATTNSPASSVSTTVTIPRPKALAYLTRVLAETKTFKQELHFNPAHETSNSYPPFAVIYGKSIPTVFGAKVDGREGIACSDSYDNLAFASGDGVCLAKEAMLPQGYRCVGGGRISSDRGHVTLLGDLNAVARAIDAVRRGREKGIGRGRGGSVGLGIDVGDA